MAFGQLVFTKTRKIASEAIKNGYISVVRVKSLLPSLTVIPDNIIFIKNDYLKQKIIVEKGFSKRESYEKAKTLYSVLEEEKSEVKEYFDQRLRKKRPTKQEKKRGF